MNKGHPDYQKNLYVWGYVRDAMEGESAVKRLNTRYLPMPSAMLALPPAPVVNNHGNQQGLSNLYDDNLSNTDLPYYHSNPAYMAYLQRARYPMLVAHTVRSFTGIAMRKEPMLELPADMEYLRDQIIDTYRRIISNSLAYGRFWIVVDIDQDTNQFKLVTYKALAGKDWCQGAFVTFQERVRKYKEADTGCRYIKLCMLNLDGDGVPVLPEEDASYENTEGEYAILVDQKGDGDFTGAKVVVPEYQGTRMKRLPVVCCGSIDLDWNTDPIPVEGILSCAAKIYMKDADLSQSEVMSCNPLLIFNGLDKDDTPTVIGSTIAISLPDKESCEAKYIEPTGSALEHMRSSIADLHGEAAEYGAQLLGASKAQVESGEALRIRQNSSGASLLSVMQLGAKAVDQILDILAEWSGKPRTQFSFDYDNNLAEVSLSPQELTALSQCWMGGGISYSSFFDRLQQAGIVSDERTAEEERALIEQEAPLLATPTTPETGDQPE